MNDTLADPSLFTKLAAHGLSHYPPLLEDTVRYPFKFHGGFGFGRTFPDYLIQPLFTTITETVENHPRPGFRARYKAHRQATKEFEHLILRMIVRTNSSPDRARWSAVRLLLPRLQLESFLPIPIEAVTYRPREQKVSLPETTQALYSWRYRTVATLLTSLISHLPDEELVDSTQSWARLCRFHHFIRHLYRYDRMNDRQRYACNSDWHLAVYVAAADKVHYLLQDHQLLTPRLGREIDLLQKFMTITSYPAVI